MATSEDAIREARNEYYRQYRLKHRERINARNRERYRNDPNKFKEYQRSYWARKAEEMKA